ncbi:MAG: SPOR domain-containing protein [Symbiobacteriaceae bacterium]|nr:SPOR domain-containing protein [Symbiobacteriaceae bacterium]
MDWQSSRGSRRNRIQKEPGRRNPFFTMVIVVVLMAAAIGIGYLLSRSLLTAFIGSPRPTTTTPQPTAPPTQNPTSTPSGETNPSGVTNPQGTLFTFVADLPEIYYYRVQVIASGSRDNAEKVMQAFHENLTVAVVEPKGELFTVQVGIFGNSNAAKELATALDSSGYPGAFVTEWIISVEEPVELTGDAAWLPSLLAPYAQALALDLQQILQEGEAIEFTAEFPEEATGAQREHFLETRDLMLSWWEEPEQRRPSRLDDIIWHLIEIYSIYGTP